MFSAVTAALAATLLVAGTVGLLGGLGWASLGIASEACLFACFLLVLRVLTA